MKHDVSIPAFHKYLMGVTAKNTARKYASYASYFVRLMHETGYQSFSDLPPGMLAQFGSMLSSEGKSPNTVRVEVFSVKKYLEWVEGKGIVVTKQVSLDLPKREVRIKPSLPQERFTEYFQYADALLEEPVRTAVMLLPCSGLRASEMVSVKLANIHKAVVPLEKGKDGRKKKGKTTLFLRVVGKGNKERNVPLMEEGVEILTGYLAGFRRGCPGPWLFPRITKKKKTSGTKHISDTHLRDALRKKMRGPLGVELTPHTLRRTYITMLYRRGVDLALLAKIAGHTNVQTTLDYYINIDPEESIRKLHEVGSSLTE